MVHRDSICRRRRAVRRTSTYADVACAAGVQCRRVSRTACRSPNYRRKSRVLDRFPCGRLAHVHRLGLLNAESSRHRLLDLSHSRDNRTTCSDRLSVLVAVHTAHRRLTWFLRKAAASSLESRLV